MGCLNKTVFTVVVVDVYFNYCYYYYYYYYFFYIFYYYYSFILPKVIKITQSCNKRVYSHNSINSLICVCLHLHR